MSERVLRLLSEPSDKLLAYIGNPEFSPRKTDNRASLTKLDLANIKFKPQRTLHPNRPGD